VLTRSVIFSSLEEPEGLPSPAHAAVRTTEAMLRLR
jgi:hypothetical protein